MKVKKHKNSFGLIAKEYQKYRSTYDPKLYHLLFSLLDKKELTILDIGCGTGKSTESLILKAQKRKVTVIGIDPDEAMLEQARRSSKKKNLSIEYIQGSAEKFPFTDKKFDAVISGAAFHWFGNIQTVKKIKTIVKNGGVFFTFWAQHVESNKPTIGEDLYSKYKWKGIPKRFRDQNFVCKLLDDAGFKNTKKFTIPFSEKRTISESIGNLKTNSSYALMSEKLKKAFIKEMTKAYKVALGNNKKDINKLELRICCCFN